MADSSSSSCSHFIDYLSNVNILFPQSFNETPKKLSSHSSTVICKISSEHLQSCLWSPRELQWQRQRNTNWRCPNRVQTLPWIDGLYLIKRLNSRTLLETLKLAEFTWTGYQSDFTSIYVIIIGHLNLLIYLY